MLNGAAARVSWQSECIALPSQSEREGGRGRGTVLSQHSEITSPPPSSRIMEEMKPMGGEGEGVIIRAFLTFPSDIMGRKEGGKRRGAKVAGNEERKGEE